MRALAGALVAGVLLAAGLGVHAFAQAAAKLDGSWTAVSAERDGKPADELEGHRLTFAGDTFVIERDGKTRYKGTFKTDPAKKPAQIDFVNTAGEAKGKTWRGIYQLDGDTLKICKSHPPDARPTEFASKEGEKWPMVVVLKRQK